MNTSNAPIFQQWAFLDLGNLLYTNERTVYKQDFRWNFHITYPGIINDNKASDNTPPPTGTCRFLSGEYFKEIMIPDFKDK